MDGEFIKGAELARRFYEEAVHACIDVPHAAALVGEGSEVLGFDQPRSTDHNWYPRVTVFVSDGEIEAVRDALRVRLPKDYNGYKIAVEGERINVEVTSVHSWLLRYLKIDDIDYISAAKWLALPQQLILQFTAGPVFRDDLGELAHARAVLSWYPQDVWLWIMACQWHFLHIKEPFIRRTLEAGDRLGARLAVNAMVRYAMELWFLQNRAYHPYDKWFGSMFRRLPEGERLEGMICAVLDERDVNRQHALLHELLLKLGEKHCALGIGRAVTPRCGDFEVGIDGAVRPYNVFNSADFENACRDAIADEKLSKLTLVGTLDQLTHADDVLINFTDWPARLEREYGELLE